MKFNSQICTTREQSERLLALGLKKETADMYYSYDIICAKPYYKVMEFMNGCVPEDIFPAWSLHRLLSLIPKEVEVNTNPRCGRQWICFNMNFAYNIIYFDSNQEVFVGFYEGDVYNKSISCIEWLIKEGYFNKEYLV